MEKKGTRGQSTSLVRKQKEETKEPEIIRFVVRPRNNVHFEVGTIDNEGMGKRKSKSKYLRCLLSYIYFFKVCCIYNKGHTLDSSSSSDEDCHSCDGNGGDKNRYDKFPKHQRRAMRELEAKKKEEDAKASGNN